jgi:hypothetical protein
MAASMAARARSCLEHETAIAVRTVHVALGADHQKDAWMAQSASIAIAGDLRRLNVDDLGRGWRLDHGSVIDR